MSGQDSLGEPVTMLSGTWKRIDPNKIKLVLAGKSIESEIVLKGKALTITDTQGVKHYTLDPALK